MLQTNVSWLQRFRTPGVQARLVAQISVTGAGSPREGTDVLTFCSGPEIYRGMVPTWPSPSIANLSGLSAQIDIGSRSLSIGQCTLEFAGDGQIQAVLARPIYLKNRVLTIWLADRDLGFGIALPIGQFIIDDLRTTPTNAFQLVLKDLRQRAESGVPLHQTSQLTAVSALWTTQQNHPIARYQFPCMHPLEVLTSWLTAAPPNGLGVASSQIGASMDPSNSVNAGIGHFCVSRFSQAADFVSGVISPIPDVDDWSSFDGGITSDMNFRDGFAELEKVLGGTLIPDPATDLSSPGQWQLKRYSASTAVVDTWGATEISDLQMQESWNEIYNAVRLTFAQNVKSSNIDWIKAGRAFTNGQQIYMQDHPVFELREVNSISRNQGPGDSTGLHYYDLDSSWLNGVMYLGDPSAGVPHGVPVGTGAPVNASVYHAAMMGCCGCRYTPLVTPPALSSGWGIPSWAQASTTQPVYLRISGTSAIGLSPQEIVRVTTIAIEPTAPGVVDMRYDGLYLPAQFVFTIDQRGLFGTVARDWSAAPIIQASIVVEDVTIAVTLFQNLLARANDGIYKMRVTTSIGKMPVQLGDLVQIRDQRAATYGNASISPTIKWEVIRKQPFLTDPKPRVEWLLALASDPFAPSLNIQHYEHIWFANS